MREIKQAKVYGAVNNTSKQLFIFDNHTKPFLKLYVELAQRTTAYKSKTQPGALA